MVKIHPLILIAMSISVLNMGVYANQNYAKQAMGFGVTFTILCIFFVGLVIGSIARKRHIDNKPYQ